MDFHLTSSNLPIIQQNIKELLDQGYVVSFSKKMNLPQNAKYNLMVRALSNYTGYEFLEMKQVLKDEFGLKAQFGTNSTRELSAEDMGLFISFIARKCDYLNVKY